jgi:hypothetical protein
VSLILALGVLYHTQNGVEMGVVGPLALALGVVSHYMDSHSNKEV